MTEDLSAASPSPKPAGAALVESHIFCKQCEYDLFRLPQDGNCPECNESVARSLIQPTLGNADPNWLRRVRWGAGLMFAGWLLQVSERWVVAATSVFASQSAMVRLICYLFPFFFRLSRVALQLPGGWLLLTRESFGRAWIRNCAWIGLGALISNESMSLLIVGSAAFGVGVHWTRNFFEIDGVQVIYSLLYIGGLAALCSQLIYLRTILIRRNARRSGKLAMVIALGFGFVGMVDLLWLCLYPPTQGWTFYSPRSPNRVSLHTTLIVSGVLRCWLLVVGVLYLVFLFLLHRRCGTALRRQASNRMIAG